MRHQEIWHAIVAYLMSSILQVAVLLAHAMDTLETILMRALIIRMNFGIRDLDAAMDGMALNVIFAKMSVFARPFMTRRQTRPLKHTDALKIV
jgi:hypothetical protein